MLFPSANRKEQISVLWQILHLLPGLSVVFNGGKRKARSIEDGTGNIEREGALFVALFLLDASAKRQRNKEKRLALAKQEGGF